MSDKKIYLLVITDRDGESHDYYFRASHLWIVTSHVHVTIAFDGNFYGHKVEDTVGIELDELWQVPDPQHHIMELA